MIFEINGKSYADHILSETYTVNRENRVAEWTDANGTKHKQLITRKIVGTVDMFFKTLDEFNSFSAWINGHITSELTNIVTLSVNNTGTDQIIYAYLDYKPTRARNGFWDDYMLQYTLEIEEK